MRTTSYLAGHLHQDTVFVGLPGVSERRLSSEVRSDLWLDAQNGDIAFLSISDTLPDSARALRLGSGTLVRNAELLTYGFPDANEAPGVYGRAVGGWSVRYRGGEQLLQVVGADEISRGFSGAPVLDERTGLVVGMVNAVRARDQLGRGGTAAYIIPSEAITDSCRQLRVEEVCPYVGLDAFTLADASWFNGRDDDVQALAVSLNS